MFIYVYWLNRPYISFNNCNAQKTNREKRMFKILLKIGVLFIVVSAAAYLAKMNFSYLTEIALIDYITYSGIVSLAIALLAFDGNHPSNQHFLSMIVHRELVSKVNDQQDYVNQVSFSLSLGIVGVIFIFISGVMAWLN